VRELPLLRLCTSSSRFISLPGVDSKPSRYSKASDCRKHSYPTASCAISTSVTRAFASSQLMPLYKVTSTEASRRVADADDHQLPFTATCLPAAAHPIDEPSYSFRCRLYNPISSVRAIRRGRATCGVYVGIDVPSTGCHDIVMLRLAVTVARSHRSSP